MLAVGARHRTIIVHLFFIHSGISSLTRALSHRVRPSLTLTVRHTQNEIFVDTPFGLVPGPDLCQHYLQSRTSHLRP